MLVEDKNFQPANPAQKGGEKSMRRALIALVAGAALLATTSLAMATATNRTASFVENHALGTTFMAGTTTTTASETGGNHYKATDIVEDGRHGNGWQLDSAILKGLVYETPYAADNAYSYTTGSNPFNTPSPLLQTDKPLVAPAYTVPCPIFVNSTLAPGSCPANSIATDPQTEDNVAAWDGIVLDDLYNVIGANDSRPSAGETRTFYQNLDQLFLNGDINAKGGTVKLGSTTIATTGRHFNIDDTLDQDIADYVDTYSSGGETMGIYNKLTLVFQLAAPVSSTTGCASAGSYLKGTTGDPLSLCASNHSNPNATGAHVGEGKAGFTADALSAWVVDQWVVSNAWDWKAGDVGMKQGYSSWFKDGSKKNFDYSYTYPTGHGAINKTAPKSTHTSIKP